MMINHIITSSLVIVFVLFLGNMFESKISACLKYSLWLLVVMKLLLPLPGFESEFHVLNLIRYFAEIDNDRLGNVEVDNINLAFQESTIVDNNISSENNPIIVHDFKEDIHTKENIIQEPETVITDRIKKKDILPLILKSVYFTGTLTYLGVFLISNIQFYSKFKQKSKYLKRYKDKIPVYKIEDYDGACLYGGFSPVIIVGNNKNLTIEQQDMIMLHEYVHYIHGDHIWSMVRSLCIALYWYNPLVWLAVSVSRKDGELACDEGTIRRIGKKQRIVYGKTLLEIIAKSSKKKDMISAIFLNSTTITGGNKEMKKRISMIAKGRKTSCLALSFIIMLSVGCIGCTFGEPVDETGTIESKETELMNTAGNIDTVIEEKEVEEQEGEYRKHPNVYTASQKDKVCILVQPSELREQLDYYYIPTEEVQEELKILLNNMEIIPEKEQGKTKGKLNFTYGWSLEYENKQYRVFESGYILSYDKKTLEHVFYNQNLELIDKIKHLLIQELNYKAIDIKMIKDIISATLRVKTFRTDNQLCEQTITNMDKLEKLELWFSNAKQVPGGYDCENYGAVLMLKTASGEEIKMSLAADDCTIFAVNGIYYDYKPADKVSEGWYSNNVFDLFDKIPNVFKKENKEMNNEITYVWPTVSTAISTTFGERVHPITGEKKKIDYIGITGKKGESVYAVADGDIVDVGFDDTLGNYIVLATMTGEEVTYGHLEGSKVAIGAKVNAGEIIGKIGNTGTATGTFLSISVQKNREMIDPMCYLKTDT